MAKNITWVVNCITMVGGVERVVCNISNYLVENGFNVKIISINTMKGQPFFPLSDKVQIEHCGYPVNDILDRKKLKKFLKTILIKENGASDTIITCHPWIAMPILQQKRAFKGKIICTEHAAWEYYTKIRQFFNTFYYRRADKLVVLTKNAAKIYREHGVKNVAVIPNILASVPKTAAPLKSKELVATGRLTGVKGYDRLLEAISLIKDDFAPWHLTLYGDGEDHIKLIDIIHQNHLEKLVSVVPFTDKIQDKLQKCSGFIVSSHNESFSLAAIEALSNGVPVISFDIPALREMDHGKSCIIFAEQNNIKDLADKIKQYIHSDDIIARGKKARELADYYTLETVGPLWLKLLS